MTVRDTIVREQLRKTRHATLTLRGVLANQVDSEGNASPQTIGTIIGLARRLEERREVLRSLT